MIDRLIQWIIEDLSWGGVLFAASVFVANVVWTQTRNARHAAQVWTGFLIAIAVMAGYGLGPAYLCPTHVHLVPAGLRGEVCAHPERVSGPFSIYMTFAGVLLLAALSGSSTTRVAVSTTRRTGSAPALGAWESWKIPSTSTQTWKRPCQPR